MKTGFSFILSSIIFIAPLSCSKKTQNSESNTTKQSKPPYRVLFNNDMTNITNCISPYHQKNQPFSPEMIEKSVDETAGIGVDAHLLCPGACWVPWWPSKVYPDHTEYTRNRLGRAPNPGSIEEYVANGGDVVRPFIERCRSKGIAPLITFRLNDGHHIWIDDLEMSNLEWYVPRFFVEHPEYRLKEGMHNWSIPEVRDYKFSLINNFC